MTTNSAIEPQVTFDVHLRRAILLPLVLFLVCAVAGFLLFGRLSSVIHWNEHSVEVLSSAQDLQKSVIDLETGIRGYELTGEQGFLQPYLRAGPLVLREFAHLAELVTDNPSQTLRLQTAMRSYEAWDLFARQSIRNGIAPADRSLEFQRSGRLLMDHLRQDLATFIGEERRLLEDRSRSVEPARASAVLLFSILLALAIATLLWTRSRMRHLTETFTESLRQTELQREGFRVTLASIGDAVIATDRNGDVNFLNSEAERMTGWTLTDAQGKPLHSIFRIINEHTRNSVDDPVERVFRERRVVGLANHTVLISKAGVEWMIEDSAAPILDFEGKISGVILVFHDAGERRRAQRALVEARDEALAAAQAKDNFLAVLSHELRTPLSPVLLLAAAGAEDPANTAEMRKDFETIVKHVEQEARLIDDLLDLTRVRSGKISMTFKRVELQPIVADAMEKIRAVVAEKNLRMQFTIEGTSFPLRGDASRLQQAFWNILGNAAKFSPTGGRIDVVAKFDRDQGGVSVLIRDEGVGMSPEELDHIFEPFVQGSNGGVSHTHRFGGLGLGLTIARSILELHHGTLKAESAGPGRGATFTIVLPLPPVEERVAPALTPEPEPPANPPSPVARGGRILVVEDHPETLATLARLLSSRGYIVVGADCVQTALRSAAREKFDLVISDIGLPDGDGYALMKKLRETHQLKGIAVSGFGMKADVERSRAAGFAGHLTKPIVLRALEDMIESVRVT